MPSRTSAIKTLACIPGLYMATHNAVRNPGCVAIKMGKKLGILLNKWLSAQLLKPQKCGYTGLPGLLSRKQSMVANMNRQSTPMLPGLLLGLSMTLVACQNTAVSPDESEIMEPAASAVSEAEAPAEAAPEPIAYRNFTVDELNRALLNELGGHRGYLPDAARDYYALALETHDI